MVLLAQKSADSQVSSSTKRNRRPKKRQLFCPAHPEQLIEAPLVRILVEPSAINGLRKRSQLMVDKLFTVPIGDIGNSIGDMETTVMEELKLALRDWLGLH